MAVKAYSSTSFSSKARKLCKNNTQMVDSETISKISEIDWLHKLTSKEKLLHYTFSNLGYRKFDMVRFSADFIRKHHINHVLSIGSGLCHLEYLLTLCLLENKKFKLVASDYNRFYIETAQKFFDFDCKLFDFYQDDICKFIEENFGKGGCELVVMFVSSCGFDNPTYIKFLKQLKSCKVKYILDFASGGVISVKEYINIYQQNHDKYSIQGKIFHAYLRHHLEFEFLYRRAGWKFKHMKLGSYEHNYLLY